MATTIRDIADRAGVSVATVSRVLNKTKPVTPSVREAVLAAVTELDYTPSRMARNLRSSRTHTIAFILSSIENPFFPELIERVTHTVGPFGYDVRVSVSASPLAQVVALHKQQAFDGVLVVGGDPDADAQAYLDSHTVPIVAIDRGAGANVPVFTTANAQGAFECACHLLEHGAAERILHIQGPRIYAYARIDRLASGERLPGATSPSPRSRGLHRRVRPARTRPVPRSQLRPHPGEVGRRRRPGTRPRLRGQRPHGDRRHVCRRPPRPDSRT